MRMPWAALSWQPPLTRSPANWAIHRQRLIDDLSKEAQLAQGAVDAYRGTDAALTAALDKMTGGG